MATKKKPAAKKPAIKKEKKVTTTTEKPKVSKTRRNPYELIQSLKTKLEDLITAHEKKIEKIQGKITDLEQKHANRIAISELVASKSLDELEAEMADAKKQQALLRKALKATR